MLTELLLGDYRKKVLSQLLLHPDADYHVRELARLTGTAAGSLHKELARLAGAGLLLRKEQGTQVRYQANRQCPNYPELAGLLERLGFQREGHIRECWKRPGGDWVDCYLLGLLAREWKP